MNVFIITVCCSSRMETGALPPSDPEGELRMNCSGWGRDWHPPTKVEYIILPPDFCWEERKKEQPKRKRNQVLATKLQHVPQMKQTLTDLLSGGQSVNYLDQRKAPPDTRLCKRQNCMSLCKTVGIFICSFLMEGGGGGRIGCNSGDQKGECVERKMPIFP